MKRHPTLALLLCFCGFALPLLAVDQPRMRGAIDMLQEAKTSDHPVKLLEEAKADLQKAAHNKGGRRIEGIDVIDDAINLGRAGEKEKMTQKIDHAIAVIHAGVDRGRR